MQAWRRLALVLLAMVALLVAGGCSSCRKSNDDGTSPSSKELPRLELKDETPGLVLTWLDAKGDFHVVQKLADVPTEGKDAVRVYLEGREEGTLDQFYIADLRLKAADGTYPVATMSRSEWELLAERRRARTMAAAAPSGSGSARPAPTEAPTAAAPNSKLTVIVYGADWCQPCKDAMRYLRRKGVNAIEKDIEEDESARAEMKAKMRRAGISDRGGIPVIDIRGKILQGFSARDIDKAIAEVTKGEEL